MQLEIDETVDIDSIEPAESGAPSRRKRWIIALLAVIGVLLIVGGIALAFILRGGSPLPDSFPDENRLPLVAGEIVETSEPDGQLTSATVKVDSFADQESAIKLLTDAGYSVIGTSGSGPDGTVYSLAGNDLSVRVEFSFSDADGNQVHYSTAPQTTDSKDDEK